MVLNPIGFVVVAVLWAAAAALDAATWHLSNLSGASQVWSLDGVSVTVPDGSSVILYGLSMIGPAQTVAYVPDESSHMRTVSSVVDSAGLLVRTESVSATSDLRSVESCLCVIMGMMLFGLTANAFKVPL